MNKLGLFIQNTSAGAQEMYSVNVDEKWACYVGDARSFCKQLAGFDGSGRTVVFVRFLGRLGYFICVAKSAPAGSGRSGDNTTGWIYVPATVDLSGAEAEAVIGVVDRALSGQYGIDKAALDTEFAKPRQPRTVAAPLVCRFASPNEGPLACRHYGPGTNYSLAELLGNALGQRYYDQYRALFLLPADCGLTGPQPLDSQPLYQIVVAQPPTPTNGFTPYIGKAPFTAPIECYRGAESTITWRREGYKDIVKPLASPQILPQEIVKVIKLSVVDDKGKPVSNPKITLNGSPITGDKLEVRETDLQTGGLRLVVSRTGYETYDQPLSSAQGATLTVTLKHKAQPQPISPTPTGSGSGADQSTIRRLKKELRDTEKRCKRKLTIGVICSLFVGLIIGGALGLCFAPGGSDSSDTTADADTVKTNGQDFTDEGGADYSSQGIAPEAIDYLNNNKVWTREGMKGYPGLDGLYDDLNNYNLDALAGKWRNQLGSKVSKFEEIAGRAASLLNKNVALPARASEGNGINVQTYIDRLDKLVNGGDAPSAAKPDEPRRSETAAPDKNRHGEKDHAAKPADKSKAKTAPKADKSSGGKGVKSPKGGDKPKERGAI